jgi:hypothetical protein
MIANVGLRGGRMQWEEKRQVREIVASLEKAADVLMNHRDASGATGQDSAALNQAINRICNAVDDLQDLTSGVS